MAKECQQKKGEKEEGEELDFNQPLVSFRLSSCVCSPVVLDSDLSLRCLVPISPKPPPAPPLPPGDPLHSFPAFHIPFSAWGSWFASTESSSSEVGLIIPRLLLSLSMIAQSLSWRGGQVGLDRSFRSRAVCIRLQSYYRRCASRYVRLHRSSLNKLKSFGLQRNTLAISKQMEIHASYVVPLLHFHYAHLRSCTSLRLWTRLARNSSPLSTKSTSRYLRFPHPRTTLLIRYSERAGLSWFSGIFKFLSMSVAYTFLSHHCSLTQESTLQDVDNIRQQIQLIKAQEGVRCCVKLLGFA